MIAEWIYKVFSIERKKINYGLYIMKYFVKRVVLSVLGV